MLPWRGPYRVSKVLSAFLVMVEDLRTSERSVVHGTKLRFFRNRDFEVTEECRAQLAFQAEEYCAVQEIMEIRKKKGELQVLVKRKVLDDEDPGRESYETMEEDVPALLNDFTEEIKASGTSRRKKMAATI